MYSHSLTLSPLYLSPTTSPLQTVKQLKKEGAKNQIYVNPGYGASNWFMPLKYHGDGEVLQHGPSVAKGKN